MIRYSTKARRALIWAVSLAVLIACTSTPTETPTPTQPPTTPGGLPPLGPDAMIFYGTTANQNTFVEYAYIDPSGYVTGKQAPGRARLSIAPEEFDVLVLMVDANDYRFTGTAADLTIYRNAKQSELQTHLSGYWMESSFGNIEVSVDMPEAIFNLPGAFDDYFNRVYVAASLTTKGLSGQWAPDLALTQTVDVTFQVRDKYNRTEDVALSVASGTYTQNDLITVCQNAFDTVHTSWAMCSITGDELRIELVREMVAEGSFIRVKSGSHLEDLGLHGPVEVPGNPGANVLASLTGKPVPGGFPVTLSGSEVVEIMIRDKDFVPRTFTISLAAGVMAKNDLEQALLHALNAEFDWVEAFDAGADRLGLQIKPAFSGEKAAIYVSGGTDLAVIGLDGPARVDGVIHRDGTKTVRGGASRTVAEALSLYAIQLAQDSGIALTAANKDQLDALIDTELGKYESFLVLFIEQGTGIPKRRAAANSRAYFNLEIGGAGYTHKKQLQAAFMFGTGYQMWQAWAHELGHNFGLRDLYAKSFHDSQFDRKYDYVREWGIMDLHGAASHPVAWHKLFRDDWIPPDMRQDIDLPQAGQTETHRYTLIPLEYPASDYSGVGNAQYPLKQVVRLALGQGHWVILANRQPGPAYSHNLPGLTGEDPPPTSPNDGGLFVTDALGRWAQALYRPLVVTLNPHGVNRARALGNGDSLDLINAFPSYDGIDIRVVGAVAGPGGRPDALRVEVVRGPGDFVELEIRPWHAPSAYGTPDIWIDWPGNGTENYPTSDPPVRNGDSTHWHPDGTVVNYIKVRVHNKGTVNAQDVVVRTFINEPMGTGDRGTFVFLEDSAPQDVPAGGFADFVFEWYPKSKGHTCVRAEIKTFGGPVGDLDLTNNWAQENINAFHPTAGSPYEPVEFAFSVNSDFDMPIEIILLPTGLVPGMDLELEKDYLTLGPDEEVILKGRLFLDENRIPPDPSVRLDEFGLEELAFNIHAFIWTEGSYLPFGGISIDVFPGYRSDLALEGLFRADESATARPPSEEQESLYQELLAEYVKLEDFYTEQGDFPDEYKDTVANYDSPTVVIAGVLKGVQSIPIEGETIDVALTDAMGEVWLASGQAGSDGKFYIAVGDAAPGWGSVMIYYFGHRLAASSLGPIRVLVP